MKIKSLFFVITLSAFTFASNSQIIADQESKFINVGLGIGSNLYSGRYYTGQVPPITASFEYIIKNELFDENSSFGVGGYLGYTSYKYFNSGWGWKYSSIVIGPRGTIHYQFIDKFDTYTGLLLGYNILSSRFTGTGTNYGNASTGGLAFSWFVGGRYFFSDNLAAMAELGYGVTYLNIGVCFTF